MTHCLSICVDLPSLPIPPDILITIYPTCNGLNAVAKVNARVDTLFTTRTFTELFL